MTVGNSREYEKFKLKKSARPVNLALASSMSKHFAQIPVVVDKNYIIQEGAERLIACQKLKIPVLYKIIGK